MGACISNEEGVEHRVVEQQPIIPIESYFCNYDELSVSCQRWVDAVEDQGALWAQCEGGIPENIRLRALPKVQQFCQQDPSQWKRFMFHELSVNLRGLDEAFHQCSLLAPVVPATTLQRVRSTNSNGASCSGVDEPGIDASECCLDDAFSGAAIPYLSELLSIPNEVHGLLLFNRLLLGDKQRSLLDLSPSKMKKTGFAITEWTVKRRDWIRGWVKLQCFSISDARRYVQSLSAEFTSWTLEDHSFKLFHKFIFRFLPKDTALQQEAIPQEEAVRLLSLELNSKWSLSQYFCAFVHHRNTKRYITVDQWDSIIDFAVAFRYEINLLQYEGQQSSAWPMLMDAFIESTMAMFHQPQELGNSISMLSQAPQ
ncbi:cullin-binding protein, putative [Bodo saltans]|uniref:Defective in cullin neddylation protein n=1 Tax=Bodo saltans TaxID=75058 RepID=A0A0S4KE42_BODSA|nr:cullin-binding protein, putative [Bodo saltans]|eukprot:CUI12352.1 cullin-binding protein, putative [Bodo saltans]